MNSKSTGLAESLADIAPEATSYVAERFGRSLEGAVSPDDIVQDAISRILEKDSEREIGDPSAYLRVVATNVALDTLRKIRRSQGAQLDSGEYYESRGAEAEEPDISVLIKQLYERVSSTDRQILYLALAGNNTRETAEMLGVSRSTVSRTLARIRDMLGSLMLEEDQ